MKKFMILGMMLFAFFSMAEFASALGPCDPTGTNCGPWSSSLSFEFEYPGYEECDITVYYRVKYCDDMAYFEIVGLSYDVDDTCTALRNELIPLGFGSYADQQFLWGIWQEAFVYHTDTLFLYDILPLEPEGYNCDENEYYSFRTISPGGCTSWRYAYWPGDPTRPTPVFYFVPVPCEEDGCCITERKLCYDDATETVQIISTTTWVETSDPTCKSTDPLYNPFDGWGPLWQVGPELPCYPACYSWDE